MNAVHFSIRNFVKQNLHALLAALFVFAAVSAVPAQIVETGVITGVVKDNSGAVVVKAHVTVRNTDTGLSSNTSTDAQGLYVSPPLNPGNYDIEVDVPGFTKVVEHVRLEVGQRATADIALAVGANAETIEVQDTAPYWIRRVRRSPISAPKKPSGICLSTAAISMSSLAWARALSRRHSNP